MHERQFLVTALLASGLLLSPKGATASVELAKGQVVRLGSCSGEPCVSVDFPAVRGGTLEARRRAESVVRSWFREPFFGREHSDAVPHEGFTRKNPGGTAERGWKLKYQSERVICIGREDSIQLRESPPWYQRRHLVLDRATGVRIPLESYFAPDAMGELNLRAAAALGKEHGIAPGDVTVKFTFEGGQFTVSDDFSVDHDGITFHWDMYEIGPRVFGAPSASLAWKDVSDIVRGGAPVLGPPEPPGRVTERDDSRLSAARDACSQAGSRVVLVRGRDRNAGQATPSHPRSHSNLADAVGDLQDGDLLWLCPGRHVVHEPVHVKGIRGLTIAGDDAKTTSLISKVDAPVLVLESCEGLRVTGLHVVHEIGSWCAENTMELRQCRGVVVSDCDLDGSGYFGLGLSACRDVVIKRNVIRNSSSGLANWGSQGLTVEDNEFKNNDRHFQKPPPEEWLTRNTLGPEGRRESIRLEDYEAPSFDCSRAGTVVEEAICQHPSLRSADARMARLYRALRSQSSDVDKRELRQDQVAWLKAREGCRSDALCLSRVFETRIRVLMDRLP